MPDQILNLHPPLVGSVLGCQYLRQRRERRAPLFSICFFLPLAGYHTFHGEDDSRPLWLPRLCEGWEMRACFHPSVQLEELRVVGACSEIFYFLSVALIIAMKNQVCGLPLSLSGWYVSMTLKTSLRFALLSRCRSLLVGTECNTSPPPGPSPATPVVWRVFGALGLSGPSRPHPPRPLLLLLLHLVSAFLARRFVRLLCSWLASFFH